MRLGAQCCQTRAPRARAINRELSVIGAVGAKLDYVSIDILLGALLHNHFHNEKIKNVHLMGNLDWPI